MRKNITIKFCYWLHLFTSWVDRKQGNYRPYSGETAPYCGHSYSGWYGKYNYGHYREGDGESFAQIKVWRFWVTANNHTEEGWSLHVHYVKRKHEYTKDWEGGTPCWRYTFRIYELKRIRWVRRTDNHYAAWFLPLWYRTGTKYKLEEE